jgi:hypothetical protein
MGWNSQSFFQRLIVSGTGPGTGLFVYGGTPGLGNPPVFAAVAPGTLVDPFGNLLSAATTVISDHIVTKAPFLGASISLNPGPFLLYGNATTVVTSFTVAGVQTWVAPAGVTSVTAEVWDAGATGTAGGGITGGPGGVGGAYASAVLAVTAGNTYHPVVGAVSGGSSSMPNDGATLSTAAGFTTRRPGGAGGGNLAFPAGGGGGGGGAGSEGGPGAAGQGNIPGGTGGQGGAGASGLFPGGNGGKGGNSGIAGVAGTAPGGGGGGGGSGHAAGAGAAGQVVLTYVTTAGTPLLASIAQASGVDPATGTAYQAGVTTYDTVFGATAQMVGGQVHIADAVHSALLAPASGTIALTDSAGLTGNLLFGALTDYTVFTVTQAVLTALTKTWVLPASDGLAIGQRWFLRAGGDGVQGSTAQPLTFAASFGGLTTGTGVTYPAGILPINEAFSWDVVAELRLVTTGAGATWRLRNKPLVSIQSGAITSALSVASTNAATATIAVSAIAAANFLLQAQWAAVVGAPTITCRYSELERRA